MIIFFYTSLGMHVDVYGGTRHSNIVKAIVYQSCHICKWPIHTVDACHVEDIRENFVPRLIIHPLIKSYTMREAAIVISIDGETPYIPHFYKTIVVIGQKKKIDDVRSLRSRFSTVHFFPTNVYPTPFSSGFNVQCDPHALAHASLMALLQY
jgi:hypothetical protein